MNLFLIILASVNAMDIKLGMLAFFDVKDPKIIFKISEMEDGSSYSNLSTVLIGPPRSGHNYQVNISFILA